MKIGDSAPAFILEDQFGQIHRLKDYLGHWVILYFYPKDNTPGCSAQACGFRNEHATFAAMDVKVFGISIDNRISHQAFAEKYQLGFPLLSDIDGKVASAYGALFRFWPLKFAKRQSFIVDTNGRIAAIYRKVNAKKSSSFMVSELNKLKSH